MSYAQRLIGRILADERARGNRLADEKVYRDEPILRTGADLLKDAPRPATRVRERTHGTAASPLDVTAPSDTALSRADRNTVPARGETIPRTSNAASSSPRAPHRHGQRVAPYAWEQVRPADPLPFERAHAVELPPTLKELRAMERGLDAYLAPAAKAFVQEARFAAAYEDDYLYEGDFVHYYPTYRAMTDEQLRGYFGWRTRVRRGDVRKTSLSFAFVYLYELVNGIGAAGTVAPGEGYAALTGFCRAYGEIDPRIFRYARTWCADYAIYHGLDLTLPPNELKRQNALKTLLACDGQAGPPESPEGGGAAPHGSEDGSAEADVDDTALFDAIATLSSYRVEQSRLMRDEGPLLRAAVCRCWRALVAYYRAHRKKTLFEHLFGTVAPRPYAMFGTALFWQERPHGDCERDVGPIESFRCERGRWIRTSLHGAPAASRDLGAIVKAADAALRTRLGSGHQLKSPSVPKYMRSVIDKQVDALVTEREQQAAAEERARIEAERRRISIDFSKLSGIRAEAALSCEALLVDEERATESELGLGPSGSMRNAASQPAAESASGGSAAANASEGLAPKTAETPDGTADAHSADAATAPANAPAAPAPADTGTAAAPAPTVPGAPIGAPSAGSPFSPAEAEYLRCLLAQDAEGRRRALAAAGVSEAMMIDAVNEKALDELGDIAIEESGDGPAVLEDYIEDVRGMLSA